MVDADLMKLVKEMRPYDDKRKARHDLKVGTDYLDYVKNLNE